MGYFLRNYFIYWFYTKRIHGPTATAMRRKRFVGECYGYATTAYRREDRPALERLAVPKHTFERRIVVAYLRVSLGQVSISTGFPPYKTPTQYLRKVPFV